MNNLENHHASQIRALPTWSGPIRLEPLGGGITNRNYLVHDGEERYVARIGADLPFLGIDRRNELRCHQAAHALGVAPEVVDGNDGVLVSRYIPGRTLDAAAARERDFVPRIARVLQKLHGGADQLMGELLFFSPFQAIRTYVATARGLGAELPPSIDESLAATQALARTIAPYHPTLCHNDMLPANILDDGDRVWIVDWEYSGIGHPLFDLAGFSVNCEFSHEQDVELIVGYRGIARKQDLDELRVFQVASLLRDALWGAVQSVASDLDFDYREYARFHFEKFRAALALVPGGSR